MMDKKHVAYLSILFLLLSCLLLPLGAVPLSRSLALKDQGATAVDVTDQVITGEMLMREEVSVHGRMDFETNDYPGSGANNRHDPRSPGRP